VVQAFLLPRLVLFIRSDQVACRWPSANLKLSTGLLVGQLVFVEFVVEKGNENDGST